MHYFQKLNLGTFIPLMHNRNSKLFLNFDYASIFSRVASRNGGRVHERRHQKEHCTLHRHYVTAGPSTSPLPKNDPINRYGEIYGRLTQRGALSPSLFCAELFTIPRMRDMDELPEILEIFMISD